MFLSIIKFCQGFVCVKLSGYAPERFFNLCSNHNILIWNLEYKEDGYEFCISVKAFRELRPILKKTKTRLMIQKRCGFPFWIHRYRKRKIFFFGILLFAGLLFGLSQFIWNIEINGNSYITDETILAYLKENHLTFGTPKKNIDASQLEEDLRIAFDDIIWTSVKIDGTKMTIDLQENLQTDEPEKPNDGKAYDIVADKDATIDTIITRQGTPLVTEGSTVKKGDVLVCGRLDIVGDDGAVTNYEYCVSDADIVGITTYSYEDSFSMTYEKKELTGNTKKQYAVELFQYRLPFPAFGSDFEYFDKYTSIKQIHICSDFYLPLFFEINNYEEYVPKQEKYTEDEAKKIAKEHLSTYLENLTEKDIQILEKNVMIDIDEKNCRVSGTIEVKETIGNYVPTEVLEVPELPADEGTNTE